MKSFPATILAGTAAAALAGTAYAASSNTHVMDVPLPDGAIAHVEYVGSVAPKVTIAEAPDTQSDWDFGNLPSFAAFDRMIEQMNQETQAMVRQAQQMQNRAGAPGMNVASFGNLPAGTNSVSMVSYSSGDATCSRTTQVVSQGAGKAPKVTSSVSGNCAAANSPAPQAAPPKAVPTA